MSRSDDSPWNYAPDLKENIMTRTVAVQMIETLAAAGVERVYGIVGDSLNGFINALRRHGGSQSR